MANMIEIIKSVEFWKFVIPIMGGVIAWLANERQKRILDQYQRKETQYKELISTLGSFYAGAVSLEDQGKFLNELNRCWLYCPDHVIKKAYAFLETVHPDTSGTQAEKQEAMGALVLALRQDLLSRKYIKNTELKPSDFKHLRTI